MEIKPIIEINYNQEKKYRYEIEDIFKRYLNREVTFGIVLNRLKLRKIIKIKDKLKE